jgi:competence protein ComGC
MIFMIIVLFIISISIIFANIIDGNYTKKNQHDPQDNDDFI